MCVCITQAAKQHVHAHCPPQLDNVTWPDEKSTVRANLSLELAFFKDTRFQQDTDDIFFLLYGEILQSLGSLKLKNKQKTKKICDAWSCLIVNEDVSDHIL